MDVRMASVYNRGSMNATRAMNLKGNIFQKKNSMYPNSCGRKWSTCYAGLGMGFVSPSPGASSKIIDPREPEFGLTAKQMQVLGLTNDAMTKIPTVENPVSQFLSFLCSPFSVQMFLQNKNIWI